MTGSLLPAQFAALEPFAAEWCLPTEQARYARRLRAPMEELDAFYNAFFPRVEEALAYCDDYSLDDLPPDVLNLMHLLYSIVAVSFSVEAWGQGKVPDTGASDLPCLVEPLP